MWADRVRADLRAGLRTVDGRFLAWAALWSVASLVGFGVLAAIIPSPIFARPIPPEPFAIVVWIASAPLVGLVAATYSAPAAPDRAEPAQRSELTPLTELAPPPQGTTLGSLAGLGAFVAIGCPVCNKVALLLLGTSGALSVFAPFQPIIGAVSLGLLVATLAWRIRLRAQGPACRISPVLT